MTCCPAGGVPGRPALTLSPDKLTLPSGVRVPATDQDPGAPAAAPLTISIRPSFTTAVLCTSNVDSLAVAPQSKVPTQMPSNRVAGFGADGRDIIAGADGGASRSGATRGTGRETGWGRGASAA